MNEAAPTSVSPKKFWSVLTCAQLALVLGIAGIHRFLVGKWKSGLLQLFTFGGLGIWALIDVFTILQGRFTDARGLVIPNTSKVKSWIISAIVVLSLLMRVSKALTHDPADRQSPNALAPANTPRSSDTTANNSPPAVVIPPEEKAFVEAVSGFISSYQSAPNELKKSAVRASRKQRIQELVPNMECNGWTGRLEEMTTTSKGNACLKISFEKCMCWRRGHNVLEKK